MTSSDPAFYRTLPYRHDWETREEEGRRYFTVRLAEIPCVVGGGPTKDDALRAMRAAFEDYVDWRLEEGLPIADPRRVVAHDSEQSVSVTFTRVIPRRLTTVVQVPEHSNETRTEGDVFQFAASPALVTA
jgi:predicted RNase H-like HicB family nuclease